MDYLPFNDSRFNWQTLESFLCQFLNAQPELPYRGAAGETEQKVISARKIGVPGGRQFGVDIEATMSNGEKWVFQCKHYKSWGKSNTEKVLREMKYEADRYFLVVTREASEEARAPLDVLDRWEFWDNRQLDDLFFISSGVSEQIRSRLVFIHFGKDIRNEMFKENTEYPYMLPDAFFSPFVKKDRILRHDFKWIKNPDLQKSFKLFLRGKNNKLFILSGIGGVGKSRFLKEASSQSFLGKRTKWNPVFLQRIPEDIESKLADLQMPCLLFLDEAEKEKDFRSLFAWALYNDSVKLVLASRPQVVRQLRDEAISANIESDYIQLQNIADRLTDEGAIELAKGILKETELNSYQLVQACSCHPLLIVAVCQLIESKKLSSNYLVDNKNLQEDVYRKILKGILGDVSKSDKKSKLLQLIALLSPMPFNEVSDSLCRILNVDLPELNGYLEQLLSSGLVVERMKDEYRIYPDVLGEFILSEACYRDNLRSKSFAETYLEKFPDQLSNMIRTVAGAEWAARRNEEGKSDDIFKPFFEEFLLQYNNADQLERSGLLEAWAKIAGYHPKYTLDLVRMVLKYADEENPHIDYDHYDSLCLKYTLDQIPAMLQAIANNHVDLVEDVLDLFWTSLANYKRILKESKTHFFNQFCELYKPNEYPFIVSEKALEWFEQMLQNSSFVDWLKLNDYSLSSILNKGLDLEWDRSEYTSSMVITVSRGEHRFEVVEGIRRKIIGILRRVVRLGSVELISDSLDVFGRGLDYHTRLIPSTPPESQMRDLDHWLEIADEAMSCSSNPTIRGVIQKKVRRVINWTDCTDVRNRVKGYVEQIEVSLESDFIVLLLSDYSAWFSCRNSEDNNFEEAKRLWSIKTRRIIETILLTCTTTGQIRELFESIEQSMKACRLTPFWYDFLFEFTSLQPIRAMELGISVLEVSTSRELTRRSYILFESKDAIDAGIRDEFVDLCLRSADEFKLNSLLMGVYSWMKREEFTDAQQEKLLILCESREVSVWKDLLFLTRHEYEKYSDFQKTIWEKIPDDLASEGLSKSIIDTLYSRLTYNENIDLKLLELVLNKLIPSGLGKVSSFESVLPLLAKNYPEYLASFIEQRIDHGRALSGKGHFNAFGARHNVSIVIDGDTAEAKDRLERLFRKSTVIDDYSMEYRRLLSFLELQGSEALEDFLVGKINNACSKEELEASLLFMKESSLMLIAHPKLAKCLLVKLKIIEPPHSFKGIRRELIGTVVWRGKGFTNGIIDAKDDIVREPLKQLLVRYQHDSVLGTFYSDMLEAEEQELEGKKMSLV